MGRRSDHNREELKQLILEAAKNIVRTKGHTLLTSRGIASKIGYAVGTLYNVFDNLEDIVLHLNGKTLDSIFEKMKTVRNFKGMGRAYLNYAEEEPNLWKMLFEYPNFSYESFPIWYQDKINRNFELAESLLELDIKLPKNQVSKYARVLWAGIHGICVLSMNGSLRRTQSESAQSQINLLLDSCYKNLK